MNITAQQLQKVQQLAEAGKLTRLMHDPARYIYAMLLHKIIYPVTHKGSLKKAPLFFGGDMEVLLPAATDIYLTGGKTHASEIRFAQYLAANLKDGNTFVDIGAHFGYFTLLASALVGDEGKVLSVEPAKGTFDLLDKNVSGKKNIRVYHNAVSDRIEEVSFFEFPVLYSEYNTLDAAQFSNSSWISKHPPVKNTVQAVTIDDFLNEHALQPDMIKMDIEGAEVQAVNGGLNTWNSTAPVVIMEYLSDNQKASYKEAVDILRNCGYKTHMIGVEGVLVPVDDILSYMAEHDTTSENVVLKKENN
ncbi:MAG: FkbM family methyltransferase [Chitinophagales bacterium]|nr:FkbM family methyltransferase [Chitinophagales bacterium]